MPDLVINNLTKRFGTVTALKEVDLTVEDGECLAVVGPSGCGKTTLLRIIAGLESQTEGNISIGGRSIDPLPPHKRGVAMVFQDYPLYPHMTVKGNLAFPMRMKGAARSDIETVVQETCEMLGLGNMLNRKPGELSGGEQQRVALGRVVTSGAKIGLLDEPLSNLDARLRVQLRGEIKSLQQQFDLTMLFVTHDQQEAAAVGDRMAVMVGGRIEQIGTPDEVLADPANENVAEFLGVTMKSASVS